LQNGWNLTGILDAVTPIGEGLLQLDMAGHMWLVSDELEGVLSTLVGRHVSILRIDDRWSAVEVST
jgi:hypothetical protein